MKQISRYLRLLPSLFIMASTHLMAETAATASRFEIIPVQTQNGLSAQIPIGGHVEAHKSIVLSAQLPGRVISISGKEGDHFKQGDLLLKLNSEELLAKRRAAEAQWASAAATLNNVNLQHFRNIASPQSTTQTPGGFGMPGMFDQIIGDPMQSMMGTREPGLERDVAIHTSGTQISQANHALQQARAQIEQIDSKLRDTWSLAPFDGVIVAKLVEEGDIVQPGQPLLEYEDMQKLQIVADIPIRLAGNLKEGHQLQARIDTTNIASNITVSNIFPKADPFQHTIRVKFDLPSGVKVASGVYAEVLIQKPQTRTQEPTISIPVSAVANRGGLPVVFVVDETSMLEMRLVRLGERMSNGLIKIRYGLNNNEQILNYPPAFVTSGYRLP
jgi:multidrug efflux pump subunit AcrA (membrane-fusion protein)